MLNGQFIVRQVFSTASGKFGIGHVNNFVYLDIKYALQQMCNFTYAQSKLDIANSPFVRLINSDKFSLGQFSTQATVNLPDRVKIYSNPDYEETYIQLSSFGKSFI